MAGKYAELDKKLFAWLATQQPEEVTTSNAIAALGLTENTEQRHVSRRFSQLEDRGVLTCRLQGTTRFCTVQKELPATLAKQRWRPKSSEPLSASPTSLVKSIPAVNSDEFLAAGGKIDKLDSAWNTPMTGSRRLGDSFSFDD